MSGAWEYQPSVLCAILHTEGTTIAWAFGLKNLIVPGRVMGISGMPFDHGRNAACVECLKCGFDYLFFLDSDIVAPHDTILRLMRHQRPLVSGVYCRRSPPVGIPVMMRPVGQWITQYPENSLIEVDVVGSGCMLIHRSVLERLPPQRPQAGKHWFDWRVDCQGVLPHGECLSEDFTFCFPAGTWVFGDRVRKIEDVKKGDRVANHMGALARVEEASSRFYSGEMTRIISTYIRGIESTAKHRFYIRTTRPTNRKVPFNMICAGGGISVIETPVYTKKTDWVEASQIKEGDWLYVPKRRWRRGGGMKSFRLSHFISLRSLTEFDGGLLGYRRTRKSAILLPKKVMIDPGLCRLIGYYLAEGLCPGEKHTVRFAFGETEVEYIQDCLSLLKSNFGISASVFSGTGSSSVVASSKLLGRLFSALCGTGAYNKHLPRFWNRLSRKCLEELLKGYWRGDGTCQGKVFSMSSMSERLSREIQNALLKLNILCGVRESENDYGTVYTMSVPAKLAARFAEVVDHQDFDRSPVREQNRYFRETKRHFLVRVERVESFLWEGAVFNLKVSGRESYTANGAAVHNCTWAKKHGISVMVDTSIMCRHIGNSQSTFGRFDPMDCTSVT